MAATDEALRHEGGPLEKTHLKDMVQRNALEALVFDKITKHIETEKKAFTRQNTRDETEMKHLLERLHQQQQTTFLDDGDQLSSGNIFYTYLFCFLLFFFFFFLFCFFAFLLSFINIILLSFEILC